MSAFATIVTAVAVTLVLVSQAAGAFELHNFPVLGRARLIIASKKLENWNWGPERGSELPKVTQQKCLSGAHHSVNSRSLLL